MVLPTRGGGTLRVLVLVSGGIDSPVALWLLGKYFEVAALHLDLGPYATGSWQENLPEILHRVARDLGRDLVLYVVPYYPVMRVLEEYVGEQDRVLYCVLCKRCMLRIATTLAQRLGYSAVATGDAVGQVASQTLRNLQVVTEVAEVPVLRPLLTLDKEEVTVLARRLGTLPLARGGRCRARPPKVTTRARIEEVLRVEERIPLAPVLEEVLRRVSVLLIRS